VTRTAAFRHDCWLFSINRARNRSNRGQNPAVCAAMRAGVSRFCQLAHLPICIQFITISINIPKAHDLGARRPAPLHPYGFPSRRRMVLPSCREITLPGSV
jgi:hypothetical protein